VHAVRVVIIRECVQLSPQVDRVPEEHPIQVLAPDGADQPFDERMQSPHVLKRLDLPDPKHAEVGELPLEAKQRVVVGTQEIRFALAATRVIEHAANRDAINVCRGDAKTDHATRVARPSTMRSSELRFGARWRGTLLMSG
jgi:hypothetical protein